jgi:UDP-N-acetylmuramoyl-tripeptide--D-alanyl-D-alanine ligase
MLELGETAAEAHREVGSYAAQVGVDRVLVVGAAARGIHEGAGERSVLVDDNEAAGAWLAEEVCEGDAVLFKASNGARLFEVASALQ